MWYYPQNIRGLKKTTKNNDMCMQKVAYSNFFCSRIKQSLQVINLLIMKQSI